MIRIPILSIAFVLFLQTNAQDSSLLLEGKLITLREVVVRKDLDVPGFVQRMKNDTSFYKAFKNLRILSFSAINDIRMLNRRGQSQATLRSKTRQQVVQNCRRTIVDAEEVSGDFYDSKGSYNYYTAALYASLFFSKQPVCGEDNVVNGNRPDASGKTGMAKHREQLKMLFFNPGTRIPGIPLMGNKLEVLEAKAGTVYDYTVDLESFNGKDAFAFTLRRKQGLPAALHNKAVIEVMTTWFDPVDFTIRGRIYHMKYNAGVYDFDVQMEVHLEPFQHLLVPVLIRYTGNWDLPFKKRERGVFTATLFGFSQ